MSKYPIFTVDPLSGDEGWQLNIDIARAGIVESTMRTMPGGGQTGGGAQAAAHRRQAEKIMREIVPSLA